MTEHPLESPYTSKRVQELLGLSAGTVAKLVAAGFVSPSRGRRNEHRFSFQDLMLLRTAHALQQASIAPRKILRSLAKLKADLPAELPLSGLRITAVGADVVVRDRSGQWNPDSGQLVMDFEVAEVAGTVSIFQGAPAIRPAPVDWFAQGQALESTDPEGAEAAYRRAIEADPSRAAPCLNLGAMLCESGRCDEAVELYAAAMRTVGDDPLIHFNLGIALEDQNRSRQAVQAYERALALDPRLADAHYNAGMVLEQLGDGQAALRHFAAYRRLQRAEVP